MFHRRLSHAALAALVLVATGSIATLAAQGRGGSGGGGGKPGSTIIPIVATFADQAIQADGAPLVDGVDGVSSYRVEGSNSTNGWAWNLDAKRTKNPRSLVYDLTVPAGSTTDAFGTVIVHDTHGQIYDLSTIPDGGTASVRASFHFFVDRTEYVVRFGQTPGDGSSPLRVLRNGDSFTVWTDTDGNPDGDVARLMLGNGSGAVLLGYYHVPFSVVLESQ